MFSNHLFDNHLVKACLAAVFAIGLTACSSSSDDAAPADETPPAETMAPEPEPATPSDLETTQMAAKAAADAAKAASDAADTAANGAEEATANIATLQTGEMARMHAMDARDAADTAMDAYTRAKAASDAAAAATTASAAGAAKALADAGQAAAETARDAAVTAAMNASDAAMSELMIDGTMKSVGESSVDATSGKLTSQDDDTVTGFIRSESRTVDAIAGVAFDQRGTASDGTSDTELQDDTSDNAKDVAYVQAVAAGSVDIGKVLDTSDDMAQLTIITAREGKKDVRVFADMLASDTAGGLLTSTGALADIDTSADATGDQTASVKSIGNFYEAENTADTDNNVLDAMDRVDPGSDPVELFELSGTITDGTTNTPTTRYARVVSTTTTNTADGTTTSRVYRAVDITAFAAVDSPADGDSDPEAVQVTAEIPVADEYSHVHFGVWAGLKDNEEGDNSVLANLGIGFVQNHDGSGVTTGHVTGTASYSGDWVAVVRPMHSSALTSQSGHADLTANFSTDEFTGDLEGLAMLEGTLSGNTFSGEDVTVDHVDMNANGTFEGSFSGAIYGPDGAEAAGVFSFDGGDAGAFVGAFGGRDDDQ